MAERTKTQARMAISRTAANGQTSSKSSRGLFALLIVDVILLGIVELFFLPLRLDGALLPDAGGFPVPVTVLIALVTTPLVVFLTAKLVRPQLAIFPLAAWVVTILVLAIAGPGGDRVLVEDWRALLLLAAGAFPGAMVLGSALGVARKV